MTEPTEKELLEQALAIAEELRAEVKELKKTVSELAAALAVLAKKDEDAKAFHDRIEEIASWNKAELAYVQSVQDEIDAEDN